MSCPDECYKIDMGCECYPTPPDKPQPFIFPFVNDNTLPTVAAIINFTANAAGNIIGYSISNPGLYYRLAPTITLPAGGATATCTINTNGQVTSVTITAAGAGYTPGTITSTISTTASNLITFDQLGIQKSTNTPYKNYPVQRLAYTPPTGGGITLASAKIEIKLSYTIQTNGVTDFTGSFLVNGIPVISTIVVDDTNATYTTVTHYSGELTLLFTDYVSYKVTSTESKLYDIYNVVGNFTVKYI